MGSCTSSVRVNIRGLPGDHHKDKKAWTRGPSWPPSRPLSLVTPSTPAVRTHVTTSGRLTVLLPTTLRAYTPTGWGHGGTRNSSTSRSVHT
jgi:hypothetical protein